MDNKIFLIIKEDLLQYPPVLSMIEVLLALKRKVVVVAPTYVDELNKERLKKLGVVFFDEKKLNVNSSYLTKIKEQLLFKLYVKRILDLHYFSNDVLCVVNEDTVCLLWSVISRYKYIIYLLETPSYNVQLKYRLYAPFFSLRTACKNAYKIICCEYNRAHIIKGLFDLEKLPIVLPNKYFESKNQSLLDCIPDDVQKVVDDIILKSKGRKIILYQGIFNSKERRLEEFILAINSMSDKYILVAMGRGDDYFYELKRKYSSISVIFIDFIRPPYHLCVTKLAYIGILTYFPNNKSFAQILNPLYCAPNKIFEYSRFGLPMIANDVPALNMTFRLFHCGEIVDYPMSIDDIKFKIETISLNYQFYRKGSSDFYDSVDIEDIVRNILED